MRRTRSLSLFSTVLIHEVCGPTFLGLIEYNLRMKEFSCGSG